jgi:diadenosine tetraphosphate (Ap4A) HIT family hydrolase
MIGVLNARRALLEIMTMRAFELDPRLAADTVAVGRLGLCELRLMNDRRWPWVILVPQRPDITEFHDLTPLDQTMLTFEMGLVAKALKTSTGAGKINIGTLGNVVPMFHLHIVARSAGDPNWPGPVWGFGARQAYADEDAERFGEQIRQAVLPA